MSVVRTAWSSMVLVHVSWSELIHRQFFFFFHFRSKTCHVRSWYIPKNKFNTFVNYEVLKTWANGHKIVGQPLPTLLDVTFCVRVHTLLHFVAFCWELFRLVENGQTFSISANGRNNSQHLGQQCCIGLHGALGAGHASIPDNPGLSLRLGLQVHCLPNSKTELFENVLIQALRISVDGKHFEKGTFRKRWRPENNNHVISLVTFRSFRQ